MPLSKPLLFLAVQLTAFWPVWRWYLARFLDSSDEPWGLLALATAVFFLLKEKKSGFMNNRRLLAAGVLTLIYMTGYSSFPPLLKAILAVSAIYISIAAFTTKQFNRFAVFGLLMLSLPIIASLQFYAGYPLRVVTAQLASVLLDLAGQQTEVIGNTLHWRGEIVSVDAPCAGIKMLWCGMYLNFTLNCLLGLNPVRSWFCCSFTSLTIFLGNTLRATALFYIETGLFSLDSTLLGGVDIHQAAGLFIFAVMALIMAGFQNLMKRQQAGGKA